MNADPTREDLLKVAKEGSDLNHLDADDMDIEQAIYWFCSDYHGGQASNLYSVLSTSKYKPGALEKSAGDLVSVDDFSVAAIVYGHLENVFIHDMPSEALRGH